ncbi:hypothetical protein P5705_22030 [Pseudomonas entomophila]|uniref:hypothetical protein n=1 Tax=Pseudomonas entomophila TaxID=312306 RepID=UPI002405DADC|nr:hypothetical protein [Pseudomonas entomophila]MDF9620335.1 hypothetical protein [Pseudomonas entomophila]
MNRSGLMCLTFAGLLDMLAAAPCSAGTLQLNLNVDLEARQFLVDNNQYIVVVLPDPVSEGTNVVVAHTLQPIADQTTLLFDTTLVAYVSQGAVAYPGTLTLGPWSEALAGNTYSFDGVQVNGDGTGLAGYVGMYYDAPQNAQPIVTGAASFIYQKGDEKPDNPSPVNYDSLNPFQTRYTQVLAPTVWVFVASNVPSGTVLPMSALRPVAPQTTSKSAQLSANATLQIGRYTVVTLSASSPPSVYFDVSINAFVPGNYPPQS